MTASSVEQPSKTATVLVAEDDAASGEFFRMALEQYGCRVTVHAHGDEALDDACHQRYDLLVLDCHLPGAGAERILSRLRTDPLAASRAAPALATSAEVDEATRERMIRLGFVDILVKPLAVDRLQSGVREALPGYQAASPLLDDAAALAQSGSAPSMLALRGLFREELKSCLDDLSGQAAPPAGLADRLHRLMASCGFCGAGALADASCKLKRSLEDDRDSVAQDLEHLRDTMKKTLTALDEALNGHPPPPEA